jgi:hypothetical protein
MNNARFKTANYVTLIKILFNGGCTCHDYSMIIALNS